MTDWKDVRKFMETGEDIPLIPEDAEMYPVVGLSFIPGYPENIHRLNDGDYVLLIRNPHNKYDSNAIEVHTLDGMLGHIPKEVAAKLAPRIDDGAQFKANVYQVRVSPENPNNPGLDILLREWDNG